MDKVVGKTFAPMFRWADDISVINEGDSLRVTGHRYERQPLDLLAEYEDEPTAPHLQFANAETDAKLIEFVEKYGPVNGTLAESEYPNGQDLEEARQEALASYPASFVARYFDEVAEISSKYRPIEARQLRQGMQDLRDERQVLKVMLELLVIGTRRSAEDPLQGAEQADRLVALLNTLCALTERWAQEWRRENVGTGLVLPDWRWSKDDHQMLTRVAGIMRGVAEHYGDEPSAWMLLGGPQISARRAVALILNAFPLSLDWYGLAPIEIPPQALLHGIRPVLFAMLRRDLLKEREIRMCSYPGCAKYFTAVRPDKACCSPSCSAKVAGNKYYLKKRKPARKAALALKAEQR